MEIRYKPNDGRMYQARADNLVVDDPTPLPDDTCSAAEPVADAKAKASPSAGAGLGHAAGAPPPPGTVIVYADGACSGNPGPAGLGVVILDGHKRVELSEYLGEKTNNIAELTAVLRAFGEIDASRPSMIYTDSSYTIGVLQKGWKAKANQELVAELRGALARRRSTRLVYVQGHAGVLLNERADALARQAVATRRTQRQTYESKGPPQDEQATGG